MASKRKNESDESTARDKKKLKIATARKIEVQSTTAVARPSRLDTTDSMSRLPGAIDVERFAEARAFEINAMQKAIKTASGSTTHRAWQTLPRHLRRRAASHDVRRVPVRLREKARAEMDAPRQKSSGHSKPKPGKEKRISRAESFQRRQREKAWLETHIWHAKRMKMDNLWGYRLALHPTEKSFRPSHRAAVHGSILQDVSYYSVIELNAPEKILKMLLELCCDPQGPGPGSKRYLDGSRILETHLYKPSSYPFDLISPITVMWRPPGFDSDESHNNEGSSTKKNPSSALSGKDGKRKKKSKGKGKEPEQVLNPEKDANVPYSDLDHSRTVWIRSHPAAFEDVFATIQNAASLAIDTIRRDLKHDDRVLEVDIADLRGQLNIFEIMGPKVSQVIKGALIPVGDDEREEFKKFWSSLANLQTTASLPRGMVIGCKVHDPRLKFPPTNAKVNLDASKDATLTTSPSSSLAQCEIWESRKRDSLKIPRYKKKDLDERRSKLLVPGTGLRPLRQDDRVPVLLIQHSLESPGTQSDNKGLHGWTLIVPAGWSMPFFSSLTHTGTHVGGLRERHMQSFESGVVHFPQDYPFTTAYGAYSVARAEAEKSRWERKPPAKRVNFDKLGTRSPWAPDWEVVLGIEQADERQSAEEGSVTTQREEGLPTTGRASGMRVKPWLLRGSEITNILARSFDMLNPGAGLRSEINDLRIKRGNDPLSGSIKADGLWKSALIMVKLFMCGRGAPNDLAIVYRMEDCEARKLARILDESRSIEVGDPELDEESNEMKEILDVRPPTDFIIGYVTTGNYSLSRGEGFSIGAIPVARLFELKEQAQRVQIKKSPSCSAGSKPLQLLVKIRDREGHKCWAARLGVLDG